MTTENITTIPNMFPGTYSQTLAGLGDYGRHRNHGISGKDATFIEGGFVQANVSDTKLQAVKTDLESRDSIKGAVSHVGDLVLDKTCEVKDKVIESKYDVVVNLKDGNERLATAICDSKYENLLEASKNAAAINLAIEKTASAGILFSSQGFAAGALASAVNTAAILLDSTKNASAQALQASKDTSALVLLGTVNQAATLAAIERCCCEQQVRELQRALDEANNAVTNGGIQTILSILSGGILSTAQAKFAK